MRDIRVADLAQPPVDQQRHGLLVRRADPPGEDRVTQRRAGPRPDGHQAQAGPPPVPQRGQRPVDARRGDFQRVRPADEVLVVVERVGGRGLSRAMSSRSDAGVQSTTIRTVCRRPELRTSSVVQLEAGAGDDRLQQAAQLVRRRPGPTWADRAGVLRVRERGGDIVGTPVCPRGGGHWAVGRDG